jgi:hypothetical protein
VPAQRYFKAQKSLASNSESGPGYWLYRKFHQWNFRSGRPGKQAVHG